MKVANPIYDIVFKYLMEDERIARTILSALLKQEVTEVHMRNNGYTDKQSDNFAIYRIEFDATVINGKGQRQNILVEVQKTCVEAEVLRFHKFQGFHYDSDDNVVEGGMHDPFVESLTHNSIIVQIPRLHGRINNRLDKVLSIFDQSLQEGKNSHTIDIDADAYDDDTDMQPIIQRLMEAAADKDVRRRMDVEDEFLSVLKSRDTEIMIKEMKLAEKIIAVKEAEEQRAQAEEQRAQAEERAERVMHNAILAFMNKGMSPEDIAAVMDVEVETVKKYI